MPPICGRVRIRRARSGRRPWRPDSGVIARVPLMLGQRVAGHRQDRSQLNTSDWAPRNRRPRCQDDDPVRQGHGLRHGHPKPAPPQPHLLHDQLDIGIRQHNHISRIEIARKDWSCHT
jgi:hypothetical protein